MIFISLLLCATKAQAIYEGKSHLLFSVENRKGVTFQIESAAFSFRQCRFI